MGDKLKGKVAVVTGAGRGLGRAHALALANQGAAVVVNDVGGSLDGTGTGAAPAQEVVNEIKAKGGKAVANYDSVADAASAEKIIKTAVDTFGYIDILVNNAGILRDRMSFNMTTDEWDAVIKVHLYGNFFCSKYAGIMFRQQKRGGRIISTSSVAALGNMGQANYA
ncbi:MAG: SDR family NAD(P)-dependent oxidoreductase, partial [Dehalococcoidia bacterium]|nr:SDR family NAD(P)-dependent oxidoreductase [Dehalococcoidia bacterium]